MHDRLNTGFKNCLFGNLLFIAFGLVCLLYYNVYSPDSAFSKLIEIIAYACEFGGFALLLWGHWLFITAARFRMLMKVSYLLYIILEAVMMIFELNSYQISFYKPYSLLLAIVHASVSGFVCLTFLQLDPNKKKLELSVVICIAIIFAGMLGNILGLRIYFSIIVNGIAYSILYYFIIRHIKREEIEIDCHGDKARVAEYKSEFVDD